MTLSFEKIIRPFETRDISPPKPQTQSEAQIPDNVVLTVGDSGSGKIMHGSHSFNATTYQDKKPKEAVGGGSVF